MSPITRILQKQLIPIANKPVSQYMVEDLVRSNVRDIIIVLGVTHPELVKEYYGDGSDFGAKFTYVSQGEPKGTAQAVSLAEPLVRGEKFVVVWGDTILMEGVKPYVSYFETSDLDTLLLLARTDQPTRFGIGIFDGPRSQGGVGRLVGLVEKPDKPPSNYAVTGTYFLNDKIFRYIAEMEADHRGEQELTNAIKNQLIANRDKVDYQLVSGWLDVGKAEDVIEATKFILAHEK